MRTEIDRAKLQANLRRLRREDLLCLLDRAIDLLPQAKLVPLMDGYVQPEQMKPDGTARGRLLATVHTFREASLRGDYYEDFMVDSKNYMDKSRGTETWIAECGRLIDRCVDSAGKGRHAEAREAFDILFDLLRRVDAGDEDIGFWTKRARLPRSSGGNDEAIPTDLNVKGNQQCVFIETHEPRPHAQSTSANADTGGFD
jgi:hypothetical protein